MRKFFLAFFIFASGCVSSAPKTDTCQEGRTPSSAGLICQQVFETEELQTPLFDLSATYDSLSLEERRLGPVQNGQYPSLQEASYLIAIQNAKLISQVTEVLWKSAPSEFAKAPEAESVFQQNRDIWSRRIHEAMDFVLEKYAERREHWPASFRDKLRKMAEDYRWNSTYIT